MISDPIDVDVLLATKLEGSEQTVGDMITEKTAKIGEKISIRRFVRYEGGIVESYIHMGGKVGVLVQAEGTPNEEVIHDVALQIAAASPVAPEYVRREEVDPVSYTHLDVYKRQAFRLRVAGKALQGARRGHGDAAAFEREISIWEAIIHGDRAGHP